MNFGLIFLTALFSLFNFLAAVKVGDFFVISGLIKKPEYNGSIAVVQKVGETEDRHRVLKADDGCIRNFTPGMDYYDECMKSILIKEINLIPIEWNIPEKLSIAQIVSNYSSSGQVSHNTNHEISNIERQCLDSIVSIFQLIDVYKAAGLYKPGLLESFVHNVRPYVDRTIPVEELQFLDRIVLLIRALCNDEPSQLKKPKNTEKLRLIGAWINQNHDFHAMLYVNEAYKPLQESIDNIWNGIGVWTNEKYVNIPI